MARPIRWLHLSDLHYGCKGKELWEAIEPEFLTSVERMAGDLGPPDLVLLTGDLAFSGKDEEYGEVDRFLDDLLGVLARGGGPEPLLVPVPGNHDLCRPTDRAGLLSYQVLRSFDGTTDDPLVAELYQELWGKEPDAALVEPLFEGYRTWFERRVRPRLEGRAHFSHFPCDFTLEVEPEGAFRLAVVGLSSTWLQYTGDDFEGRLLLPLEQLRAALAPPGEPRPYAVFERSEQALLLIHQPPDWLSDRGREIFDAEIYPPGRFAACLYGHMHEADSRFFVTAGAKPKALFQSPSLFGLERWGKSDEERAMGFTWGQITADGEIRLRPLEYRRRGDGSWSFGHDPLFHEDPEGVLLRPGRSGGREAPAETRGFDLGAYLDAVIGANDHIKIRGIAAERSRDALSPAIENLYTPLSCRELGGFGGDLGGEGLGRGGGRVRLTEILPRGRRLLIEGQPGAGKTTFLRFVACMLARDARRVPCPGGGSWRRRHLGLDDAPGPAPLPVFLRLGELVPLLAAASGDDDRGRLLELLELDTRAAAGFDRRFWEDRLADGRAWLLLDGLDEVADLELRQRVFAVVRDAMERWDRAPMVIASRPFRTEELRRLGFLRATVEPFHDAEIQRFLRQWVAALHAQDPERALRGDAGRYLDRLEDAILARPAVRALAGNPVMLTCLSVVHWNQGELPEGRARVYRAVIHWLLQARDGQRRSELGLGADFAERTLAQLALECMGGESGKRSVVDLADAVEVVAPVFERQRPDLEPAERQDLARRWLLFECEGSGVVEEIAGERLRFWHLTFQEYLAALELARPAEGRDWWPLLEKRLEDAQWRETVELFATCLYDLGHADRVDRLLHEVLALRREDDLESEARVTAIIGRLLPAVEVCGYKPGTELRGAYEEARARAMEIFEVEGARRVPVELRIAAAEALGRGGDPRLLPEVDNFLPVPGLEVKLGRYPVTVEEYHRFVEERGYETRRFWDDEGWALKEKGDWEAPGSWVEQLRTPNRPVVEVSCYEAVAYCRWLSNLRRQEIRLPAEKEWETAATHPDGPYPWGTAEPDEERVNFDESKVGHPTPVGVYPLGKGPHGHLDLGGNVWEWCSDRLGENRPLRGGSWSVPAQVLRSAIRSRNRPRNRYDIIGFRVSLTPASLKP